MSNFVDVLRKGKKRKDDDEPDTKAVESQDSVVEDTAEDTANESAPAPTDENAGSEDDTTPETEPKATGEPVDDAEGTDSPASSDTPEDDVDELKAQILALLVEKDGRLADPADLPFDPEYLKDPEALYQAITDLITRKPGLKARGARGDVGAGQGNKGAPKPIDLIDIIKNL